MKIVVLLAVLNFYGCNVQITIITVSATDYTALLGSDALIPCEYSSNEGPATLKWFLVTESSPRLVCSFNVATSTSTTEDYRANRRGITCPDGSLKIPNVVFEDNDKYGKVACMIESPKANARSADFTFQVATLADDPEPYATLYLRQGSNFVYDGVSNIHVGRCVSGYAYPQPTIEFFKGDVSLDTDGNLLKNIQEAYGQNREISVYREFYRTFRADDDNAIFYCVITSGFGRTKETNLVQKLEFERFRVEHVTSEVDITADKKDVFAGDKLTLTCKANGFPEPTITILASSQKGNVLEYILDVTKEDHNREILCSAQHPGSENQFTKSYTVTVYYADEPTIMGQRDIKYGGPLTLECSVTSNPSPKGLKWTKDGSVVSTTKTLMILKTNFNHSGVYTCVVENQYEQLNGEKKSIEVYVNGLLFDDPMLVNVVGSAKDTIDLKCIALSNDPITFNWTRIVGDREEKVESEAAKNDIELTYTSEIKVGPLDSSYSDLRYICAASNGKSKILKSFLMPNIPTVDAQVKEVITYTVPAAAALVLVVLGGVLVTLRKKGIICKGKKKPETAAETVTKAATDTAATNALKSKGKKKPEAAAETVTKAATDTAATNALKSIEKKNPETATAAPTHTTAAKLLQTLLRRSPQSDEPQPSDKPQPGKGNKKPETAANVTTVTATKAPKSDNSPQPLAGLLGKTGQLLKNALNRA